MSEHSNSRVEIHKARPNRPRMLVGTHFVNYNRNYNRLARMVSNKFEVVDDFSYAFPYSVDGDDVSFTRLKQVQAWLREFITQEFYTFDGEDNRIIRFAHEKHRTLLLLKWS
jgi:hypothetical protein